MGDDPYKKRWKVVDSLYNPRRIDLNFRQNKYKEFLPISETKLKKKWENYLPWLYE